MVTIKGLEGLRAALELSKKNGERAVIVRRNAVMATLLEALIDNIPVWSGRTLESIRIGSTASFASLQGTPTEAEAESFGRTSELPLGSEPMRAPAEAAARGQLTGLGLTKGGAYLTIHSEAWALVERAVAPDKERARNRAVVSEIALQTAKAVHGLK